MRTSAGKVWTKDPDGTVTLKTPDGKTRVKDPDGKITATDTDGNVIEPESPESGDDSNNAFDAVGALFVGAISGIFSLVVSGGSSPLKLYCAINGTCR